MKTQYDATGQVLLVTGGTSGIGRALAEAYHRAGGIVHVFGTSANPDVAAGITSHQVDVANRAHVFAAVTDIVETEGRIDALVAAAAVQPRTTIVEMDPAEWQRTIDVNLNGVMWAVQAVLPTMIEAKRGAILAFSSGLANVGHPGASAYAASKGALIPWIKSDRKSVV